MSDSLQHCGVAHQAPASHIVLKSKNTGVCCLAPPGIFLEGSEPHSHHISYNGMQVSFPLANKMYSFYLLNFTAASDTLSLLLKSYSIMIPFLSLFLHVSNHSFSFEGFLPLYTSSVLFCPMFQPLPFLLSLHLRISMS